MRPHDDEVVGVIDALPETRGAKRFQTQMLEEFSTLVFLCYYSRERDHKYDRSRPRTIHAARTLALDETFEAFRRQQHRLPPKARELAGGAYYEHMQALVRTTAPDDSGQPIPTYVHTRPHDFGHAETYITLAASRWGIFNLWWE